MIITNAAPAGQPSGRRHADAHKDPTGPARPSESLCSMTDPLAPKHGPHFTPAAGPRAQRCPWRWWIALLILTACVMPFDPLLMDLMDRAPAMAGDLRRSVGIIKEYGQVTFIALAALVIWLQDPARRRWLLDWLAAILVAGVVTVMLKVLLARPRPVLDDPFGLIGPFRAYDFGPEGPRYSWELFEPIVATIWSMPSNHSAFAAIMSVFLARHYPRLAGMAVVLAAIVGFGRISAGAHYPSDVTAGLLIGWAVSWPVIHRGWGVRALDWIWIRLIDRSATPAYPALARENAPR
jgi:membrane-associated phospholipid phosphatase